MTVLQATELNFATRRQPPAERLEPVIFRVEANDASTSLKSPVGAQPGLCTNTNTRGTPRKPQRTMRARTRFPQTISSKSRGGILCRRAPSSATVLPGVRIGAVTVTTSAVILDGTATSTSCRLVTTRRATRSNRRPGRPSGGVPGGNCPTESAFSKARFRPFMFVQGSLRSTMGLLSAHCSP